LGLLGIYDEQRIIKMLSLAGTGTFCGSELACASMGVAAWDRMLEFVNSGHLRGHVDVADGTLGRR
jgi:hypothetical protein